MDTKKFFEILESESGLRGQPSIIVGVSGGPDSRTLLHLLAQTDFALVVAHFDHGLRPESKEESEVVKRIAESMDLPFHGGSGDVAAHAKKHSLSIEEAAREQRYTFLFGLAQELDAQAVAVGHTADDQIETQLMHFLRGAGMEGMRGMAYRSLPTQWSDTVPLLRPLLSVWREEVLAYCAEKGLEALNDPSNTDQTFLRNRLRHDLLPILESYNPRIKEALLQSTDLFSEDHKVIQALSESAWAKCLHSHSESSLALARQAFLKQPLSLQRMILQRAFHTLRSKGEQLDFDAVQRALQTIQSAPSGAQDWLAGLFVMLEDDLIWLADWAVDLPIAGPQLAAGGEKVVQIPGTLNLKQGWLLQAEERTVAAGPGESSMKGNDPFEAWLDLERVGKQLILRTRRPGDRFQPLGMHEGSMKVSDFMINVKMPQRARDGWPLLSDEDQILWVPGYRPAQPYRLRKSSRKAIHVSLKQRSG